MKKIICVLMLVLLTGCSNYEENIDDQSLPEIEYLPIYYMEHLSGPRVETTRPVAVLFEFDLIGYTKYQISYLSCGCRSIENCYQQVTYVELTDEGVIQYISFDEDSNEHYTAAMWGDSNPTPAGKTKQDFEEQYVPFLIGKTPEELAVYSSIEDLVDWDYVDEYSGSSVSVNNILRALQGLQEYHIKRGE